MKCVPTIMTIFFLMQKNIAACLINLNIAYLKTKHNIKARLIISKLKLIISSKP